MRILLVTDSLDVGGSERHVVDLAAALSVQGHDVKFACSESGPLRPELDGIGVPIHVLTRKLVKRRLSLSYANGLRRLVRDGNLDIVHAHGHASAVASTIATLGTAVPVVVTEHSEATWRGRRATMTARCVYRHAARVIAVSRPIQKRLTDKDQIASHRVTLVPNAVPTIGTKSVRGETGPRPTPYVGIVARLQPEKGIEAYLRAAALIAAEFPHCRFPVVGDGALRLDLESRTESLGMRDRVQFLGMRPDARVLIGNLDVLVVPSVSEGSPLVTLEAMSSGVPIVAFRVGGIPDQVRHRREGILVPPGDVGALAKACMHLLRDPAYAGRLGEAGRERIATRFSHAEMVGQVERVYGMALGMQRRQLALPATPEYC